MKMVLIFAIAPILLSACATVVDKDVQSLQVIATCKGKSIPAQCTLENDRGFWEVNAPGSVNVLKDNSGLKVTCQTPYFKGGTTELNAGLNGLLIGNALLGGMVGVGIDAFTGKAFNYKPLVRVAYAECR